MTTTSTIGTGVGRDYATITAWESATDNVLTQITIGEVYHDGTAGDPTYTLGSSDNRFIISGATASSTNYRILRGADQYDFKTREGVYIERVPGTSVNLRTAFEINENFFRLERMAVKDPVLNPSTSGESRHVYVAFCQGVRVSRCYLELSTLICDGTNGTASGDALRFGNTSSGIKGRIENNIIVGGGRRGIRGATGGIRIETGPCDVIGNTVLDVVGHNAASGTGTGRGINMGSTTQICVGNLVCRNVTQTRDALNFYDFSAPGFSVLFAANISSDETADLATINYNSLTGQTPLMTFAAPGVQDVRLSLASWAGSNEHVAAQYAQQGSTEDYFGEDRSTTYASIGAVEEVLSTADSPPTDSITTIGSGGDYATVAAWETATRGNLITANERRIGELLGAVSGAVEITGALTDKTRYRMLRPASGAEYRPESDTGASITGGVSDRSTIKVTNEAYFRIEGPIKVSATSVLTNTDGEEAMIQLGEDADHATIDGAVIKQEGVSNSVATMVGILARNIQTGTRIQNCLVIGGEQSKGPRAGIRARDLCDGKIYNCTVHGVKLAVTLATQVGIATEDSCNYIVKNNIAIDNGNTTNDFDLGTGTTASNNLSSDSTGDITGKTAGETFFSHGSNNFYLVAGTSPAIDEGENLLAEGLREDLAGNGRNVPFDLGALDGLRPYPRFPSAKKARRRVAHCFEIERRDGIRLQFTDNITPITFRGVTWSPASFTTSARRRELGNKPASFEAAGGITSDRITVADLRAGKYQGARMTEYMIDWRYPHLEPLVVNRYRIEGTTFDGEQFTADVQGLPYILRTKVGNFYGRTCRHSLGNSECRAAFATQTNIPVLAVIEPRSTFYIAHNALAPTTDDYYRFGKLVWNSNLITTDVYSNTLVDVNLIPSPNQIDGIYGVWDEVALSSSQVTNGFDTGINAWRLSATATNTPHLIRAPLTNTWAEDAPEGTKVVFSVYIKRDSTSPSDHAQIQITSGSSNVAVHQASFRYAAGAWNLTSKDPQATVKVEQYGATDWYRVSLGLTVATIPDTMGIAIRVGNDDDQSNSENLLVARAQLETFFVEPTAYTENQRMKIVLALRSDFDIEAAARFSIDPGCDKRRATCKDKFANIKNFGGFPYVPGEDGMFDTPINV